MFDKLASGLTIFLSRKTRLFVGVVDDDEVDDDEDDDEDDELVTDDVNE